ncbi:MAG: prepilin-type N-terminal cleavage/methylation domain-containing protein [bacterium]
MLSNLDIIMFRSALILSMGKARLSQEPNIARKAFTLSEVLIALTVVGVVGAIVIPPVYHNIQDAQNKTAFVSVYSVMDQATKMIMADNGNSLKGVFTDNNTMKNKYAQYLNTFKSCNNGQVAGNCWHKNDGSSKQLNGIPASWTNLPGIILNGTLVLFWGGNSTCTTLNGTVPYCGLITIDINGFKGPNIIGKDIYYIYIQENDIKPWGTKGDGYENTCIIASGGWGCAAKVLKGG